MRIDTVLVEDHVLEKIQTKHAVDLHEVEEVCYSHAIHVRRTRRRLIQVFGTTSSGRHLFVVLVGIHRVHWVVTARDMNLSERRLYGRQTRR